MNYTVKISFDANRPLTDSEKYSLLSGLSGYVAYPNDRWQDELAEDLVVSNVDQNISKGRSVKKSGTLTG